MLDIVESLFALRGFEGVSVRDITDAAGVRNASINYHFDSKENLFAAVIDRRVEEISRLRLEKLAEVKVDPNKPLVTTRTTSEAFAGAMKDLAENGGTGWRNYCILIAHLGVQKIWTENTISKKYDQHAKRFVAALQETFPQVDDYQIHCCFQFLLSTTLYAVCDNQRIDTLSNGAYTSQDLSRIKKPFFDFVANGIVGVVKGAN